MDKRGQYNNVEIDFYKINTSFGEDIPNFIQNLLKEGKIKEIFTQTSAKQISLSANNIPQINTNIN